MSAGRPHFATGFSIVELLVALVVLATVSAIALPSWNKLAPWFRLNSSARQLQSELHNLKMRAASENSSFQLIYEEGAAEYTVQSSVAAGIRKGLPPGVTITKAGTISFSPRGTASPNRVRLQTTDGLCRQVVTGSTGRVRICLPDDCLADC
jgi:prepilin-type N-terminal cleavage/methylation domain-containing protein